MEIKTIHLLVLNCDEVIGVFYFNIDIKKQLNILVKMIENAFILDFNECKMIHAGKILDKTKSIKELDLAHNCLVLCKI